MTEKKQISEQSSWLAVALEHARQTSGSGQKSYAVQDQVDRLIDASPNVSRIRIFAERRDVLRFACVVGERFMYRDKEIVPVRHKDALRPWLGVVPSP